MERIVESMMRGNRIVCIEGELKGGEIPLETGDCVVVGRDPRICNLVFQDMTISRKHCSIELDNLGEYYVTDYSECGIETDSGEVFGSTLRVKCPQGTVLHVGKAGTKIALE